MTWTPKPEYRLAPDTIPLSQLETTADWIRTNPWLTQGPLVRELEAAFAKKVGAKHAVFVNSGSSANLLAWLLPFAMEWLLGVPEGGVSIQENRRVVVPAVSWATSVMPAIQFGYEPVLCDADPETWGLDVGELRRLCENETKGPPSIVLLVHVLGVPCDMKAIGDLAKEFGFVLIEDSCAAFGSKPVGLTGELATYSTYYGHQFSTIEGGFVCSESDDGANVLRMLRSHGWAADCDPGFKARLAKVSGVDPFREKFTFYVPGFNVRGTDLAARIGLEQLKLTADPGTEARRRHHGAYRAKFAGSKVFSVQVPGAGDEVASIGFGVLASSQAHRTKVGEALRAKGIETRPIGAGNTARQPYWQAYFESKYGKKQTRAFAVADRIHDCGFQLPNGPHLDAEDVEYIADTVLAVAP